MPMVCLLDDTTDISDEVFSNVDVFVSAVDSVDARNVIERLSHMHMKPMINGGTEGFAGSQGNYVPLKMKEYLHLISW